MENKQSLMRKLRPKNIIRNIVTKLPKAWQFSILRSMINLPSGKTDIVFKVAQSQEELEAAYAILHSEYVHLGYMDPVESGLRVTPFHALPSTSTLIAKQGDEVVATVSIVRDSSFGFPMDRIFSIEHLKENGARLAEISSLAIKREHRQNSGKILFLLLKYLYEYSTKFFGVDYMTFAVHPDHFTFYEALLYAEPLDARVTSYGFVKGAPAKGGYVNLRKVYKLFAFEYGKKKDSKNLFRFFTETKVPSFEYPDRRYYKVSDPTLTPELLKYFFIEKTSALEDFTEKETAILHHLYQAKEYRDVLPKIDMKTILKDEDRKTIRYDVSCQGRIVLNAQKIVKIAVENVSIDGFKGFLDHPIRFGTVVNIQIAIADFEIVDLRGWPAWVNGHYYGFRISESCERWKQFIQYLDEDQNLSQMKKSG